MFADVAVVVTMSQFRRLKPRRFAALDQTGFATLFFAELAGC